MKTYLPAKKSYPNIDLTYDLTRAYIASSKRRPFLFHDNKPEISIEASSLGIRPGVWPKVIVVDGIPFFFKWFAYTAHEQLASARYYTTLDHPANSPRAWALIVWND